MDSEHDLANMHTALTKRLKVTWHCHDTMDYVGITISRNRAMRQIKVSMQGLIEKDIMKYGDNDMKTNKYPSKFNDDINMVSEDSPPMDRTKYLGLLMTLMYPSSSNC